MSTSKPSFDHTTISLSAYYFFFCCTLGGIFSYWAEFLTAFQYNAKQIAAMSSVFLAANIIATNVWAFLSLRTQRPIDLIRLGLLMASILFIAQIFLISDTPSALNFAFHFLAYGLFSGCFMGVLAQTETVAINGLKNGIKDYGAIRLWGSVGFIFAVLFLGLLLEKYPTRLLIYAIWVLVIATFICSLTFPRTHTKNTLAVTARTLNWKPFLSMKTWCLFLAIASLNFSLGSYYTFFSLYMESFGHAKFTVSLMWTVAILGEIILFLFLKRFITNNNLGQLLALSIFLSAIRWSATAALPTNIWLIFIVQTFHAFTYALAHTACIGLMSDIFGKQHRAQGIAFYSAFLVSASVAFGALVSGFFWQEKDEFVFVISAISALVGLGFLGGYFIANQKAKPK